MFSSVQILISYELSSKEKLKTNDRTSTMLILHPKVQSICEVAKEAVIFVGRFYEEVIKGTKSLKVKVHESNVNFASL